MDMHSIFALFGGLALFIFGMQQMGEGLQKTAGEKMRSILAMLTGTPLRGVIVGALVTMIIQSSSATTVMVVGFVSAGLMTLNQAIGVIMGANIGTTMTAWIVAAKIDEYAWFFVAAGFIMMFAFKNQKVRSLGQIIFAFGVLFVGLNGMSAAMKPLAKSEAFANLLLQIKDIPVLGLIVGAITTMVVQSSSAAIGVLQTLAATSTDAVGTPLISINQAIPILLGSNIGTTITAILAAISGSRQAKRAAAAHSVFNIVGSVIFMFLLTPYTWVVTQIMKLLGATLVPINGGSALTPVADSMRETIAVSHTVFNFANTLLWLPFVWLMVKLVRLIVRGEDPIIQRRLAYIDYKVIHTPSVAIDLANKELVRMTEIATQMTEDSHSLMLAHTDELVQRIKMNEESLDYLENEIVRYLSHLFRVSSMTDEDSVRIAGLMHATNDIERIGDYCNNICESSLMMRDKGIAFSEDALKELDEAFALVRSIVNESIQALRNRDLVAAGRIMGHEDEIDELEKRLRESHLARLGQGNCDPQSTVIFLELIHTMERISDHCRNLADIVANSQKKDYIIHEKAGA